MRFKVVDVGAKVGLMVGIKEGVRDGDFVGVNVGLKEGRDGDFVGCRVVGRVEAYKDGRLVVGVTVGRKLGVDRAAQYTINAANKLTSIA